MDNNASNAPPFPTADATGKGATGRTVTRHTSINSAASGAHDAIDNAAGATKPAVDRAARFAHRTVDKAASAAMPAADWLSEKTQGVRVSRQKLVGDTRGYVSAHPLKAIGAAAAIGFLIGRLLF
jgi:ElaB/YqjD/DUF883 family membrane-anchored ribosome-binding protein